MLLVPATLYQSLYQLMLVHLSLQAIAVYSPSLLSITVPTNAACTNCSLSITVPTNVCLFIFTGNQLLCLLCIALASYQSLYPLMLLEPAALSITVPTYVCLFIFTCNQLLCLLCIALASYQSLYPLMLLVPAALYLSLYPLMFAYLSLQAISHCAHSCCSYQLLFIYHCTH